MIPEIVATLHGPRLPEAFTMLGWTDFLAMFGLGLLLGSLALWLLSPLFRKRKPKPHWSEDLRASRTLPSEERGLALARLLVARGGSLPEDQRQALYAGAPLDHARLESLIRGARGS